MSTLFDLPFEEPPPEPSSEPAPDARRRVLTVSELTATVRELLEQRFVAVWVDGEISNYRPWRTGHAYFTLKDEGAQLKAVMFRSAVRYLTFTPEDGLKVIVRGRVTVYEPKGEYQIVCEHMEPRGLGSLQLAYDQLRERLDREGLFDAARKRPLPALPRKIGVVTSLDGAAVRDVVQVIRRRYSNAHVVIRPARVQGEGAAGEIADGLRAIARVPDVDVVIVARGGGSMEDLWAFNEEVVARAIAACPVPVIAGVGHETDTTIADFVADLRAPTPSAAAELVVARKREFGDRIGRLRGRLTSAMRGHVDRSRDRVHRLASRPAFAGWPARLALRGRHAAELTHELRRVGRAAVSRRERQHRDLRMRLERADLRRRFAQLDGRVHQADAHLAAVMRATRQRHETRLRTLAGRLGNLSPLAVLARGYALCWDASRTTLVRDAGTLATGDTVRVTLRRGEITCEVTDRSHAPSAPGDR